MEGTYSITGYILRNEQSPLELGQRNEKDQKGHFFSLIIS